MLLHSERLFKPVLKKHWRQWNARTWSSQSEVPCHVRRTEEIPTQRSAEKSFKGYKVLSYSLNKKHKEFVVKAWKIHLLLLLGVATWLWLVPAHHKAITRTHFAFQLWKKTSEITRNPNQKYQSWYENFSLPFFSPFCYTTGPETTPLTCTESGFVRSFLL